MIHILKAYFREKLPRDGDMYFNCMIDDVLESVFLYLKCILVYQHGRLSAPALNTI
jgi:hypothetical protein